MASSLPPSDPSRRGHHHGPIRDLQFRPEPFDLWRKVDQVMASARASKLLPPKRSEAWRISALLQRQNSGFDPRSGGSSAKGSWVPGAPSPHRHCLARPEVRRGSGDGVPGPRGLLLETAEAIEMAVVFGRDRAGSSGRPPRTPPTSSTNRMQRSCLIKWWGICPALFARSTFDRRRRKRRPRHRQRGPLSGFSGRSWTSNDDP